MKNKALVEISVPAAGEKYDAFIPLDSKMSEVVKLVATAMSELSQGRYKATDQAVLFDAESGAIYNVNMMVAELGIKNGSSLVLI